MIALYSFTNDSFEAYTMEHFLPLILAILIGWGSIRFAKRKLNPNQQRLLGFFLSLFPFFCILGRMSYLKLQGTFDPSLDLPFFLCRFMAMVMPFVMYFRHRTMLGVLYFWVLAGTVNAVLTPDLLFNFGHWEMR